MAAQQRVHAIIRALAGQERGLAEDQLALGEGAVGEEALAAAVARIPDREAGAEPGRLVSQGCIYSRVGDAKAASASARVNG